MNTTTPPALFDTARIAQNRGRASFRYRNYAFLKDRVSSHLLERLEDVSRVFERGLDIGAHDGALTRLLAASPQVQAVKGIEPSAKMAELAHGSGLEVTVGDLETLEFEPGTFDLVTSALSLHWANDLPGMLVQVRRVLKPDGLFLGALFGGATLNELRTSLIEAESSLAGGVSPRVSPMPGLQDMAGLLQRAGLALPVADVERISVRYDSPLKLMEDLRGMGEQAAFAKREGQERRPLSRRLLARMAEIYHERFSDPDGRVRATFEVIWLSGWAPSANQPKPLKPGSGKVSLAEAVRKARDS